MNGTMNRVDRAVIELERLNKLHHNFIEFVGKFASARQSAGVLKVDGDNFTATCLAQHFQIRHRIIAAYDALPSTIEYSFITNYNDSDLNVFNMYLEKDGVLYKNLNKDSYICDAKNERYLAENVLNELALKLLDSEIFAPSNVGYQQGK